MTSARVLSVARELAPGFTSNTLRTALTEEVADPSGRLVRLREGLLAVRESTEEKPVTAGTAHVHVLEVLNDLRQQGVPSATWAEVQAFLSQRGMPYGASAVQHALTQLVRDHQSPVRRVRRGSYSVVAI